MSDISSQGFFVESGRVYKPGVIINCELTTRNEEKILVECRVKWSKKGSPRLNHIMKSGMVISILKFLQGEGEYYALNDLKEKSVSCHR